MLKPPADNAGTDAQIVVGRTVFLHQIAFSHEGTVDPNLQIQLSFPLELVF